MTIECPYCRNMTSSEESQCVHCGAELVTSNYEDSMEPGEAANAENTQNGDRFDRLFRMNAHSELYSEPLPEVGPYAEPATLTLFYHHQPVFTYELDVDQTIIGRTKEDLDVQPDLDLIELDEHGLLSVKHCCIFRQNKNYTLYVMSNAGTQLNDELLELGDNRKLSDQDIIVLSGFLAMKFDLPKAA